MAKRSSTKRTHVSPGIYYKETEMQYATKSLGLTTLGLAGETLRGPAFQPISISDWREFQTYFGGTSTEKFRGSQYPKYELPYIAQEYLKQSKQLEVVRTLGLSGVNAGPAWVITATKHNCKDGYVYEKTDNAATADVKGAEGKNGVFGSKGAEFSYSTPKPVESLKDQPEKVAVIDSYVNEDCDIIYFDDNKDDFFTILPEGIQLDYKNIDELQKEFVNQGEDGENQEYEKSLFYIGLDNGLYGGYADVVYENANGEGVVVKHIDIDGEEVKKTRDDNNVEYRYVIIPFSEFESAVADIQNNPNNFNMSNVMVYQYGYEEIMDVEETGKTYEYGLSKEKTTICEEDEAGEYNNVAIAVIRSRGEHKKAVATNKTDECGNPVYTYDGIEYFAKKIELVPSKTLMLDSSCNPGYNVSTGDFTANAANYGTFNIIVDSVKGCEACGIEDYIRREYAVSLNPNDKNYITKVLGTDPELGDADIYVEELYDVALEQLIYAGKVNAINHEVAYYPVVTIIPDHEPVDGLLTKDAASLTRNDLGKRFLYTYAESELSDIHVRISKDDGITWADEDVRRGLVGHIYTVMSRNNAETGKKEYFYGEYRSEDGGLKTEGKKRTEFLTLYQYHRDVVKNDNILRNCVEVASENSVFVLADFYDNDTANEGDVQPITLDFNNYKEEYRYASTPWFVSELKGSGEHVKLHRLFRLHTISDGADANTEVKVSIENIDPELEIFDVVIRSFYDSDVNPNILERFGKCSLKPGESNYLGLRIGTLDGSYVAKSAYVVAEINEDDVTAMSIPCGFLGYPVRNYNGLGIFSLAKRDSLTTSIKQPYVQYNTNVDEELKLRKQYFGMSDLVGIDEDILSYKGVAAYSENPEYLTPCFHLDARILNGKPSGQKNNGLWYVESAAVDDSNPIKQVVDVDGITGYTWSTVARTEITSAGIEPRIGTDDVMEGTIYEDKAARKFTACFYGGWDGWDYYRTSRSNGDEFRYNKYKGSINRVSGQGSMFSVLRNPETYGFSSETKVINSDYYAYLAAVRQLDNPKNISINLFATPGIDYVNQTSLVGDIIDIIEEDRSDALYVVTTPDKPFGAGDSKAEMYTPEEAVYNLEDTEIDTNYACTYYPWEQYYDSANNQYIYLPLTRDVVRNMAYTDNIAYPWYASAGWNRGDVSGVGPRRKLKLAEQDVLYDGRINFVNSFAKEGDRIWGDKNLQVDDGIMNRISKRRLLIHLKAMLSTACVGLLFDPNDAAMAETFKSSVKAVLDPIKASRGITDYRIEVDDSKEARDRLELPAKIFIKPTQMLEYIDIELNITPQGVNWE